MFPARGHPESVLWFPATRELVSWPPQSFHRPTDLCQSQEDAMLKSQNNRRERKLRSSPFNGWRTIISRNTNWINITSQRSGSVATCFIWWLCWLSLAALLLELSPAILNPVSGSRNSNSNRYSLNLVNIVFLSHHSLSFKTVPKIFSLINTEITEKAGIIFQPISGTHPDFKVVSVFTVNFYRLTHTGVHGQVYCPSQSVTGE